MKASPIRLFGLKALLWLPLAFFLWFVFAEVLVWPVVRLAGVAMTTMWPSLFTDIAQAGQTMDVGTRVLVNQAGAGPAGGIGELVLTQNPMIYGYALPLFSGLAMATPITTRRRLAQFALAFALIWLAQSFGVVAESLKLLAFDSGEAGAAAIARAGIGADAIALAYQFGYLILPAVAPVALWLGLNRDFVQSLVHPVAEPAAGSPGPSPGTQE
ncbi:MAG: hypothetical protein J0L88_05405 [Xanthomonadales bacterium]|nr:hypothetical protein [Xanthomonadales bacterium]